MTIKNWHSNTEILHLKARKQVRGLIILVLNGTANHILV